MVRQSGSKSSFLIAPAAFLRWVVYALVMLIGALASGMQPAHAVTGINSQINYQARLLNSAGATVPDGNYNIQFKIYQDGTGCVASGTSPCGGTLKWTEEWLNNNTQGVTVTNGYFSVALGAGSDSAPLGTAVDFNQSALWLSINVGNTNGTCAAFASCSGDGEMLPFTRFTSAPYAMNSGLLGGLTSSQFARSDANNTLTGTQLLDNNSVTGLVVQNTASNKLLVADTTNQKLGVGAAPSAGGATLQVTGNATISSTLVVTGNLSTTSTGTIASATTVTAGTGFTATTGDLTLTTGNLVTGSTQRLSNAGALGSITGFTQTSGTHSITSAATSGNIFSVIDNALNTTGANTAHVGFTNTNASGTATTVNGLNIAPAATANAVNTVNGINLAGVTSDATNFNAITVGSNYDSILLFGATQLISGAGIIQNAAFSSGVNYTGIVQVGALTSGSINWSGSIATSGNISTSGSGTISSASSITATGAVNANGGVTTTSGSLTLQAAGNTVQIGSATTDTTQVNLQLDSFSTFADTGTCNATTNQGAIYYNTNTNAIRSCVNSAWEDIVTTGELGILAFGVVSDTGLNSGDMQSLAGGSGVASGPCQPYWKSATAVAWTGCTAYSGGRKVIVAANSTGLTTTNGVAGQFQHLCLTAAGNQPALSTAGTEVANLPAFSSNNPILCLADLKFAGANNTITNLYDTRVFSDTSKHFVYTAVAMGLNYIAIPGTNTVTSTATAAQPLEGTIVASNGAAWASGGPNAIMVNKGQAFVKTTAAITTGQLAQTTTTTGYATSVANPGTTTFNCTGITNQCSFATSSTVVIVAPYTYLGPVLTTSAAASACSSTVFTCGSALVNIEIR